VRISVYPNAGVVDTLAWELGNLGFLFSRPSQVSRQRFPDLLWGGSQAEADRQAEKTSRWLNKQKGKRTAPRQLWSGRVVTARTSVGR
jgi:hypothetical protein